MLTELGSAANVILSNEHFTINNKVKFVAVVKHKRSQTLTEIGNKFPYSKSSLQPDFIRFYPQFLLSDDMLLSLQLYDKEYSDFKSKRTMTRINSFKTRFK